MTRERRKELADAVDRAAAAFALMDRRVAQFAAQVGTRAVPADVQHAADLVADVEVELRSALFSLRIRLPGNHLLPGFFNAAEELYTQSYLTLAPLMTGDDGSVLGASSAVFGLARDAREAALRVSRDMFRYGPTATILRRRYFAVREFRAKRWEPSGHALSVWTILCQSEAALDDDGWTAAAAIDEEADSTVDAGAGLAELVARGWVVRESDGRVRPTLHGMQSRSRDA